VIFAIVCGAVILAIIIFFFAAPSYFRRTSAGRGTGSHAAGFLGIGDELFNPNANEARRALEEQSRLVVPAPSPDGDKGISDGKIRILVEESRSEPEA
jgi:hypothetical protein